MPRAMRVSEGCLSASSELRQSYNIIVTQTLPKHRLFNQSSPIAEEIFKYNTVRSILGPKARQQQAHYGRQILLLAHHLLAQVCLDSCEHGTN